MLQIEQCFCLEYKGSWEKETRVKTIGLQIKIKQTVDKKFGQRKNDTFSYTGSIQMVQHPNLTVNDF